MRRREFLLGSGGLAAASLLPTWAQSPATASARAFSFVLLGDLHYDKLEHHDLAWLDKTHPNDLSQIQNYTRITRDIMPALFTRVRETVAELNRRSETRVPFVLHAGDLVEGLCGSEELSVRQNEEALAFVRDAALGAPFLFTKGNHDITGDGAAAAFRRCFHPFLQEQLRAAGTTAEVKNARFTVDRGPAQFVFFDAYEATDSLAWFEAVVAQRKAEHFIVVVHPPVVPYGARATWHVFASDRDRPKREKLLELLGRQRAIVLGGHIHKYNALTRETGGGRFAQFALSSVIESAEAAPKNELGPADYTPDQIRVEPKFSPETEAARRAVYEAERPFVRNFAYADLPGYAVVHVDSTRVTAQMYAGTGRTLWRTVDLTALSREG